MLIVPCVFQLLAPGGRFLYLHSWLREVVVTSTSPSTIRTAQTTLITNTPLIITSHPLLPPEGVFLVLDVVQIRIRVRVFHGHQLLLEDAASSSPR